MQHESGRSLIEVIGVLAITAIMTSGAIAMYSSIRNRQTRTIAAADMEQTVKNIRLLMGARGDYTGVSVDYLVKSGALRDGRAPIGDTWSVTVGDTRDTFVIHLNGLSQGECDYFTAAAPSWATQVRVNGSDLTDDMDYCLTSSDNQLSFVAQ